MGMEELIEVCLRKYLPGKVGEEGKSLSLEILLTEEEAIVWIRNLSSCICENRKNQKKTL
jgi:hypothetical protein